jgi:hypothetical protein
MRRPLALLALFMGAVSPVGLSAHEGHAHKLMGTVTSVHAEMKHVEMKTTDGKAAAFYVTDSTKYLKDKTASSLAELKPGTRVVVTATENAEKKMIASEVQFGVAGKP